MTESLNYDLTLVEIDVTIGSVKYILREASGKAACIYRNAMFGHTTLGPEGNPVSFRGIADIEPLLVSLCLFKAEGNTPVTIEVVREWPSRILTSLYDKAKEISNLAEDEDTEESLVKEQKSLEKRQKALKESQSKKVPSNTTDGSA